MGYARTTIFFLFCLPVLCDAHAHRWTLIQAEQRLLSSSPTLAIARAQTQADQNKARFESQLPDPTLSFGPNNLDQTDPTLSHDNMSAFVVGLSQQFPPWGKLGLIRRSLNATTTAAHLHQVDIRAQLLAQVRTDFVVYYYSRQALTTLQHNQQLYNDIAQSARTRYQNGQGSLAEVLRARFAASGIPDQISQLKANLAITKARLAALLTVNDLHIAHQKPVLPPAPHRHTLFSRLHAVPAIAVRQALMRAAQDRLRAARRDTLPTYGVGASYAYRTAPEYAGGPKSPNQFSIEIDMSLPLFPGQREDQRIDRRQANLETARAAETVARFTFLREAHEAYADYRAANQQLMWLKQTRLPQAQAANRAALHAFATNRLSLPHTLRYANSVTQEELARWTLAANRGRALAQLLYLATRLENAHAR